MTDRRTGTGRTGWAGNRWLLARRTTQLGVLAMFLLGPLAGLWIIRGNLNSSLLLETVPLTDPLVLLQSWLAGHQFASQAAIGGALVVTFYLIVGGRSFCAWVCPLNIVTDTAHWLRRRTGLQGNTRFRRHTRYGLLAMSLVLAAVTGTLAWEWVNPVSMLHRGIIYGIGAGWAVVLAVFILDLAVSRRAWCGRLCPMGAFYSLLGTHSPLRVRAERRSACNQCMDCFDVCPEPQVIKPALFGAERGIGPVIDEPHCTNCGRCIDVCPENVFRFGTRFNNQAPDVAHGGAPNHHPHDPGQKEART